MTEKEIIFALNDERNRQDIPVVILGEKANLGARGVTFYSWLNGRNSPNLKTLIRVADVLGMEIVVQRKTEK